MSDLPLVAPFRGERYAGDVRLSDVVAPPYDVINEGQRATLAERHAGNVVHVILPQDEDDRYARAAARLAEWRQRGWLVSDPEPSVYVVSQRFMAPDGARRVRTGVIAAVVAEPFTLGRVKPHERTHAGPKQDRLDLLRATATMGEALLMLSRDGAGALRAALAGATVAPPVAEATLDQVEISLWRVDGEDAISIAAAARGGPLYIADGHHRYETTVAYRAENPAAERTLALIVPLGDPGLAVLPTHRLVRGSALPDRVLNGIAEHFAMDPLPRDLAVRAALSNLVAAGGGCIVVLPSGAYRVIRRSAPVPPLVSAMGPVLGKLDVAWADGLVVPALLEAAAGEGTLDYTPDLNAALRAVQEGNAAAAVLLNPPAVEDVLAVADAATFMPPKATFFTPKVPSGLVFLNYGGSTA